MTYIVSTYITLFANAAASISSDLAVVKAPPQGAARAGNAGQWLAAK